MKKGGNTRSHASSFTRRAERTGLFLSNIILRERGVKIMQVYDELGARGLIAQVTNEEEIKKMVN